MNKKDKLIVKHAKSAVRGTCKHTAALQLMALIKNEKPGSSLAKKLLDLVSNVETR